MSKHLSRGCSICLSFALQCAGSISPVLAADIAGTYTGTYSGTYAGSYDVSDFGAVTITIDTAGNVFCYLTDFQGNTKTWANGTAISFVNGTENGNPLLQVNMSCATAYDFRGTVLPVYGLGMSGSFEVVPSGSIPTIEGSWFAGNGEIGIFTASFSPSLNPATTVDSGSLSGQ